MRYYATLFINNKKDNPKQPDYTGEVRTPENTNYSDPADGQISGWTKTSKSGRTYISLIIKDYYKPQHRENKEVVIPEEVPELPSEKLEREKQEQKEMNLPKTGVEAINPEDLPF